ncbi:universal stress protein [Cryobacterium sp. PH31-O1]|uniref:universal stress protein n=1 Tax=Cryobacterium sp. PH31-O1 TaxID=3046306 RepID=UPI0024BAF723|nr:universal stress protein [Cryobacterium sp. PH31-O1]MDJ0338514.1 universal stress protein [Cryobacterium sp. PH31-O1]
MTHTLTRSQTVVAWDGSEPARAALDWSLARSNGGDLTLVRILDRTVSSADYFTLESATERAREVLKDDADRVSAKYPTRTVHADLRSGDPITELRALSGTDTLVVVGTHRRRGSTLRYEWSMGARLAGSANGPIAIIPESDNKHHSGIVVGVDGSTASNAAVEFAAAEADISGQELHAIHAWQEPLVWRDTTEPDARFLQTLETSHRRILDESLLAVSRRYPALGIRASLVRGAPQSALLDAARGAALLVVGDHGLKGVSKVLLGSVSHSIVLNIQSPMVIIPAPPA